MSVIFSQRTKVHVWLVEKKHERLEGYVAGFDEYMNTVLGEIRFGHWYILYEYGCPKVAYYVYRNLHILFARSIHRDSYFLLIALVNCIISTVCADDCYELNAKTRKRTPLGRLLLKGDNIVLIQPAPASGSAPASAAEGGASSSDVAASSSSSSASTSAPPPPPPPPAAAAAASGGQ